MCRRLEGKVAIRAGRCRWFVLQDTESGCDIFYLSASNAYVSHAEGDTGQSIVDWPEWRLVQGCSPFYDHCADEQVRSILRELPKHFITGVISGRSLRKIRSFVGVPGLFYAGSHGFDILAPTHPSKGLGPKR